MSPATKRFLLALCLSAVFGVVVGTGARMLTGGDPWSWPATITGAVVVTVAASRVLRGRWFAEWVRFGPRPEPKQWNEDML